MQNRCWCMHCPTAVFICLCRHRFSMPDTPWPMPADQLWYSIDIGPVHFIALNTEVFYTLTDQQEKQLKWLHDDLQRVNSQRDEHPWIVVLGHRPMYCSHTDAEDELGPDCASVSACLIRSKLDDLFFEEGVDLYISARIHFVLRGSCASIYSVLLSSCSFFSFSAFVFALVWPMQLSRP